MRYFNPAWQALPSPTIEQFIVDLRAVAEKNTSEDLEVFTARVTSLLSVSVLVRENIHANFEEFARTAFRHGCWSILFLLIYQGGSEILSLVPNGYLAGFDNDVKYWLGHHSSTLEPFLEWYNNLETENQRDVEPIVKLVVYTCIHTNNQEAVALFLKHKINVLFFPQTPRSLHTLTVALRYGHGSLFQTLFKLFLEQSCQHLKALDQCLRVSIFFGHFFLLEPLLRAGAGECGTKKVQDDNLDLLVNGLCHHDDHAYYVFSRPRNLEDCAYAITFDDLYRLGQMNTKSSIPAHIVSELVSKGFIFTLQKYLCYTLLSHVREVDNILQQQEDVSESTRLEIVTLPYTWHELAAVEKVISELLADKNGNALPVMVLMEFVKRSIEVDLYCHNARFRHASQELTTKHANIRGLVLESYMNPI